jgi:glycosyltransferase involved in cell wall biosynthesis
VIIEPLVSVVMPSFNQAQFIEAAVRSVLEQDCHNLELVVVDGGSTDGTLQRLESLLAEFGSRLRWVSERDSGPANAVNKALSMATGDIIGWLNSDDLYAPGAVGEAVRHFAANPDVVMVYGEGEHIDAEGRPLGRYPTRAPSATIQAFQDGCFICQPTAFLRREVFVEVGYLQEGLVTAFDFELWLRVFRRFPDRIGYLDRVQAYSRLHNDCITQRMRRLVAVEGVKILARHVGKARVQWVLAYLDELYSSYPFGDVPSDLPADLRALIDELKDCFDEDGLESLNAMLAQDARLKIALPGVFADVSIDGWASKILALRFRDSLTYCSLIRIQCAHLRPVFAPLSLAIRTSWGSVLNVRVEKSGPFELAIPLPRTGVGANVIVSIESENVFVPSATDPKSGDGRQLAFKVHGLQLE